MSSVDVRSLPAPRLARRTIAAIFSLALVLALAGAVALNAGPHLHGTPPSIVVPASAMSVERGRGGPTAAGVVLEATGPDGIGLIAAPDVGVDGDAYSRITWHFAVPPPGGTALAMTWSRRERAGTVFTAPIDWSRGDAAIDLTHHPDWGGAVHGIGLAVRGRLPAPLVLADARLRSNAWDATLAEMAGDWIKGRNEESLGAMTSLRHEATHVAPLLPIVATAVVLAVALVAWRNRRRGEAPDVGAIVAIVLAGWLVLDLRWQALLWQQHAAALGAFAGRTLDEKRAAERDAPIFAVARRVRDAERPRGGRVLVLSDNTALATRVAWFLYPDNVWVDMRRLLRGTPPPPDALKSGDQVVLLLKRDLVFDAANGRLVWPDGRSRAARAILVDGPEFALLEIR